MHVISRSGDGDDLSPESYLALLEVIVNQTMGLEQYVHVWNVARLAEPGSLTHLAEMTVCGHPAVLYFFRGAKGTAGAAGAVESEAPFSLFPAIATNPTFTTTTSTTTSTTAR